jgi:hypothetical protein
LREVVEENGGDPAQISYHIDDEQGEETHPIMVTDATMRMRAVAMATPMVVRAVVGSTF